MDNQSIEVKASPIGSAIGTTAVGVFSYITGNAFYIGSIFAPITATMWLLIAGSMLLSVFALKHAKRKGHFSPSKFRTRISAKLVELILSYVAVFAGAAVLSHIGWVWNSAFMALSGFGILMIHLSLYEE